MKKEEQHIKTNHVSKRGGVQEDKSEWRVKNLLQEILEEEMCLKRRLVCFSFKY